MKAIPTRVSFLALAALAVAAGISSPAVAQEATYDYPEPVASNTPRAASAPLRPSRPDIAPHGPWSGSVVTRAQVRAEAVEARRLGVGVFGELVIEPSAAQAELIRLAGLRTNEPAPRLAQVTR